LSAAVRNLPSFAVCFEDSSTLVPGLEAVQTFSIL